MNTKQLLIYALALTGCIIVCESYAIRQRAELKAHDEIFNGGHFCISSNGLLFGADFTDGTCFYYKGRIGYIKVYDHELSPAEVNELYRKMVKKLKRLKHK